MKDADEQWPDDYPEGECESCHERRRVFTSPDPFIAEIYPENNPQPQAWCRPCYRERLYDT